MLKKKYTEHLCIYLDFFLIKKKEEHVNNLLALTFMSVSIHFNFTVQTRCLLSLIVSILVDL